MKCLCDITARTQNPQSLNRSRSLTPRLPACLHAAAAVGLGTWQYNDTVAEAAATLALSLGYTHIDTAIGYGNQAGIAKALAASPRKRESYFITSKVPGGLSYADAMSNLTESVEQLGLDYVDLMLVHFPATWGGKGGKAARQGQWKAMEDFQKSGKTRAIGISHYCEQHIADILEVATIPPAINQVQFHVGGCPRACRFGLRTPPRILYIVGCPLCLLLASDR
eukprot:SAG22_NODE_306_length_12671_cov_14.743239_11_plen_224_part_00